MKVRPPVKLNPITTAPPVDLVEPDGTTATRVGNQIVSGSIVYDRSLWFVGEGAPPSPESIGAKSGDCYLDSLTGDVYKLVI
jgi:hypothetical protein